ncbi:MAG TPA: hypothetical protein VGU20_31870 [Stellaceae bacterium]|nr:hypothetical protein [Stellaceae bacterium]
MRCLYRSDYGPPDPSFEAFNDGIVPNGVTRSDVAVLATAENIGQFEAMQRKLAKGEAIIWCDQGYGWVHDPMIEGFFALSAALVVPLALFRLMRRLGFLRARTSKQRRSRAAYMGFR